MAIVVVMFVSILSRCVAVGEWALSSVQNGPSATMKAAVVVEMVRVDEVEMVATVDVMVMPCSCLPSIPSLREKVGIEVEVAVHKNWWMTEGG